VCLLVADTLGLGSRRLRPETPLLGQMVEFDSMAVVAIITALEERYGILVDDEELTASIFEDVASLARFVSDKCRP
jgi:acyl carrier protein